MRWRLAARKGGVIEGASGRSNPSAFYNLGNTLIDRGDSQQDHEIVWIRIGDERCTHVQEHDDPRNMYVARNKSSFQKWYREITEIETDLIARR